MREAEREATRGQGKGWVIGNVGAGLAALVSARWRASFRHPGVGRELAGMLRGEGLGEIGVEEFPLLVWGLAAVDVVYDVVKTVEMMQEDWKGEDGRLEAWFGGAAGDG